MKLVTFWTDKEYYEDATRLHDSLRRHGAGELRIFQRQDLGSWQRNTRQKAVFLREMLDHFKTEPLLWIDADSFFAGGDLSLLDAVSADVSFGALPDGKPLSGTMKLKNNERARDFLDAWDRLNRKDSKLVFDDLNIIDALRQSEATFVTLPPEYCWIDSAHRPMWPDARPVIVQLQRSRLDGRIRR